MPGPLTKERSAMNTSAARVALLTLLTSTIALAGCGTALAPKAPARPAAVSAPAGQGMVSGQLGWAPWRVTSQGPSPRSDGGRHFAPVALPPTVAPADVLGGPPPPPAATRRGARGRRGAGCRLQAV